MLWALAAPARALVGSAAPPPPPACRRPGALASSKPLQPHRPGTTGTGAPRRGGRASSAQSVTRPGAKLARESKCLRMGGGTRRNERAAVGTRCTWGFFRELQPATSALLSLLLRENLRRRGCYRWIGVSMVRGRSSVRFPRHSLRCFTQPRRPSWIASCICFVRLGNQAGLPENGGET